MVSKYQKNVALISVLLIICSFVGWRHSKQLIVVSGLVIENERSDLGGDLLLMKPGESPILISYSEYGIPPCMDPHEAGEISAGTMIKVWGRYVDRQKYGDVTETIRIDACRPANSNISILPLVEIQNSEFCSAILRKSAQIEKICNQTKGNISHEDLISMCAALGDFYSQANNNAEAAKWYRIVSLYGVPEAQFKFGFLYFKGQGVAQSYREAMKWFSKAAEQGNKNAQYELGIMYADGLGIFHNKQEAYKWLKASADQGNKDAEKRINAINQAPE